MFQVSGFGFRVSGFGFQVSGFGFRVSVSDRIRKSIQSNSKDVGIPTPFRLGVACLMKVGSGQDESISRATPTWRIEFGC